jgi:polysaccharide biosynthesis protein PslH
VRILWIKADKLLPLHSGGNIRSYNILRQLNLRHEVTLFSYYAGAPDPEYNAQLARHFPNAVCLATRKRDPGTLRRRYDYAVRLSRSEPYAVTRADHPKVRKALQTYFESRQFDVVICDFLLPTRSIPPRPLLPVVLFQHNVESEIWRRHAETESNLLLKLLYRLEFRKMLAYERAILRRVDHIIAVSQHDRNLMAAWVDPARITVVPTGVDLEEYSPQNSSTDKGLLLMFVGAMDSKPNVDAVEYFCAHIWPLILAKAPEAKFRIVGRNPSRRVRNLASKSVEITGTVPSISGHLREATAVVIPLRIGGGTRLKIYEAMALGKPVVSTMVGAEGLELTHGENILIADDPRSFADAACSLLQDAELRQRIGFSAAALARRNHWSVIARQFSDSLEKMATQFTHAVAAS